MCHCVVDIEIGSEFEFLHEALAGDGRSQGPEPGRGLKVDVQSQSNTRIVTFEKTHAHATLPFHCANRLNNKLPMKHSKILSAEWSEFTAWRDIRLILFPGLCTSSSAAAERPREPLSQLKSCQLLHNCRSTKNHI